MTWLALMIILTPHCCLCQHLFFKLEKEDTSLTDQEARPILNETDSSETSCFLKCLRNEDCCLVQVTQTTITGWIICSLFPFIDMASVSGNADEDSNIYGIIAKKRQCSKPSPDCQHLFQRGYTTDGVYNIIVNNGTTTSVWCDMTRDGGGWTVFQRRMNGAVDFQRTWQEYKSGFGNVKEEYWLGNEHIHHLTDQTANTTLIRIEGTRFNGERIIIIFKGFRIESESNYYKLHTGEFEAGDETAANSWSYADGQYFATKLTYSHQGFNCVNGNFYGWWYGGGPNCHRLSPNAQYNHQESCTRGIGIVWFAWTGYYKSLKNISMSVKAGGV